MTEIKKYRHIKYIPHRVVLWHIVYTPVAIIGIASNFITQTLEKICYKLVDILPQTYTEEMVEWEQLSPKEQKAIEKSIRARRAILSQVQIVKP